MPIPTENESSMQQIPRRYKYVGHDPKLKGHTALGQWSKRSNGFVVQIDDPNHPWSHGWYLAVPQHWEEIKPT